MTGHSQSFPALPAGVRAIRTTRYTCYGCGASQGWSPAFDDPFDKGYQCEHCGTTALNGRDGRPIGRRSKDWPAIEEWTRMALSLADSTITAEVEEALIRD